MGSGRWNQKTKKFLHNFMFELLFNIHLKIIFPQRYFQTCRFSYNVLDIKIIAEWES